MKKLIVIFFLIGISAQAQVWDKHFYVPSINTQFGQPVGAYKLVACAEDSTWYILTARREKTDSLATAVRLGEYKIFYGGSPWYHSNGATLQQIDGDSLIINRKLTSSSSDLWIYSRSPTTPTTSNADIYLSGSSGSIYIKAMKHNPPFSNAYAQYTLAPSVGAISWAFKTDEFGTYAYQLDEYGFYPTDYTTAGTYNQYIGTPGSPWNATFTKRVNLPATDTTGVGSTANVGTMMYYNGHFYGLKAGLPPTWVQLDN